MKTYFQDETAKAIQNFTTTKVPVSLKLIYSVASVKKATALANNKIKFLDDSRMKAICQAVDEIHAGKFDSQFVTDQVQGGAGTSTNMNVNEVISSRAEEILDDGTKVHPNDHVNLGQSTNDSIPTAIKLMTLGLIDELQDSMKNLSILFRKKSTEYSDIVKVGRTHLQDAVPITLGQSFGAYASFIERNIERFEENKKYFLSTNLGGTAIGSGINSSADFIKFVNEYLAEISGYKFVPANDLFDATQNSDNFLHVASLLKTFTAGISKICNDLRMLGSGPRAGLGELFIPEQQKGSSIMPGKVNPVILEMMNQICYQIFGNTETAFHAALNSQFELNVMLPIYAKNMIEGFSLMTNGLKTLQEKVIVDLKPNEPKIKELLENSLCMSTALNRYLGYDQTSKLVKNAVKNGTSLRTEVEKAGLIPKDKYDEIVNPKALTEATNEFVKL